MDIRFLTSLAACATLVGCGARSEAPPAALIEGLAIDLKQAPSERRPEMVVESVACQDARANMTHVPASGIFASCRIDNRPAMYKIEPAPDGGYRATRILGPGAESISPCCTAGE